MLDLKPRSLLSRVRSVWWAFTRDTDCCECIEGLERSFENYEQEIEVLMKDVSHLTNELDRLKVENDNLKRELEFVE